jgi:hypothetical protein
MSEISSAANADAPHDVEVIVQEATTRIKARMTRAAADIIEIGQDLITVKKALSHGCFLSWISTEFSMSDQTARRFMHVAEAFGDKINTVLDLSPTVLYELAAPSTPATIRAEAIERAAQGEPVSLTYVRERKQEAKECRLVAGDGPIPTIASADLSKTLEAARREFRGKLASLSDQLKDAVECILDRYPEEASKFSAMLMVRAQELQAAGGESGRQKQTKRLTVVH